jgi:hypothetical protein
LNKAQKEVLKASLNDEKRTIRELKQVYKKAKDDVEERIRHLSSRTDMENLQTIIYQKKYQEVLKEQLDDILDKLNTNQFDTVSDYLVVCYENGYIGAMYDLQHQGIPLAVPINQKQVVKALQTDTKLSSRKYKGNPLKGRFAEDIDRLKLSIRAELSRSVANGSSWNEVAVKIARGMNNPFDKAYRNALLIARTEGHRIQQSSALDACHVAKDKGADIVKQWDSTMDRKTRRAHMEADGQIRELDEPFDVWGEKMDAPAIGGTAKNVCNCRCQLLQRARWALDEAELETLKKRAEFFGLDKSESFEDYKQKYLKLPKNADKMELINVEGCSSFADLKKYFKDNYDIEIDDDVLKLNFDKVKSAMNGVDATIKRYPQLSKQIKNFGTDSSGMMCTDGATIYFNPRSFGKADKSEYDFGFGYEWFAGSHEAGHCIDMILCQDRWLKENPSMNLGLYDGKTQRYAKWELWNRNAVSRGIVTKAINNVKKQHPELKNKQAWFFRGSISNYSLESTAETVAEAVGTALQWEHEPPNDRMKGSTKFYMVEEIMKIIDERMKVIK